MPTVVLNAYSKAYPLITNRIRGAIYLQSSPQAFIAEIIDTTSGHPERTWSFPGLPRENYGFVADEIDADGNVIRNLAKFDVVPGEVEGQLIRDDEQITADTTTGFDSNTNTFTFDGTDGKPDYIGWEIVPSELTGRGILAIDKDYTWDKNTALFTLVAVGDVFPPGIVYNIHFNPILEPIGNSYPTVTDFEIRLVTATGDLLASDFSKCIIIEPAGNYIELTLPLIDTVVAGRSMFISHSHMAMCCAKIKTQGGNLLKFLRGSIYTLPGETIEIYKFTRSAGVYEYRVKNAFGNFANVGQIVNEDSPIANTFGKIKIIGESVDVTKYARLYNEVVLNLAAGGAVNYDDWEASSKTKYSLANSANPANNGKFMLPLRAGLFDMALPAGVAGDYYAEETKFTYRYTTGTGGEGDVTTGIGYQGAAPTPNQFKYKNLTVGTRIVPNHYLINKYIVL